MSQPRWHVESIIKKNLTKEAKYLFSVLLSFVNFCASDPAKWNPFSISIKCMGSLGWDEHIWDNFRETYFLFVSGRENKRKQKVLWGAKCIHIQFHRQNITEQGWLKEPYKMGIPTFKYEKIELLVCIYEISRELVFIYRIFGCSQCVTPATIGNPIPFHPKFIRDGYFQAN